MSIFRRDKGPSGREAQERNDARTREEPFGSAERSREQDREAEAGHEGARPEPSKTPGLDGDVVGR